jgi:hypothetical protein
MRYPHDPRELLIELDRPLRVKVQRQVLRVYDPITNERTEKPVTAFYVRFADKSVSSIEHVINKIEIAPNLWVIVAACDEEGDFWLSPDKPDEKDMR